MHETGRAELHEVDKRRERSGETVWEHVSHRMVVLLRAVIRRERGDCRTLFVDQPLRSRPRLFGEFAEIPLMHPMPVGDERHPLDYRAVPLDVAERAEIKQKLHLNVPTLGKK